MPEYNRKIRPENKFKESLVDIAFVVTLSAAGIMYGINHFKEKIKDIADEIEEEKIVCIVKENVIECLEEEDLPTYLINNN